MAIRKTPNRNKLVKERGNQVAKRLKRSNPNLTRLMSNAESKDYALEMELLSVNNMRVCAGLDPVDDLADADAS
ncbi:MAG: hypothetical protein JKY86_07635 [Gammaproteobacteria bacterium]|nr:hypothetical protein [Gammaproteobacteria bacterium]